MSDESSVFRPIEAIFPFIETIFAFVETMSTFVEIMFAFVEVILMPIKGMFFTPASVEMGKRDFVTCDFVTLSTFHTIRPA